MKKLALGLVGLAFLAKPALAQQQFPPPGVGKAVGGYPDGFLQHLTLSNGLVSYWRLDETSGDRKDLVGPRPLHVRQGNTLSTVASVGGLTGTRFTQGGVVVADAVVTPGPVGTGTATITSGGGNLPIYAVGDVFWVSSATNNSMAVAQAQGSAFSVAVRKDGSSDYDYVSQGAISTTFRQPNWLTSGDSGVAGFGGFSPHYGAPQSTFASIIFSPRGQAISMWIRVPTGAPIGKTYVFMGSVFASNWLIGDANSTQLNVSCVATDFSSTNQTQAGLALPAFDTWYFIVCSYDPTTRKVTLNRDNGAAINVGSAMPGTLEPYVGNEYGGSRVEIGGSYRPGLFGGQDLSDVGIWNKIPSSAEMTYLYNAGAGRKY